MRTRDLRHWPPRMGRQRATVCTAHAVYGAVGWGCGRRGSWQANHYRCQVHLRGYINTPLITDSTFPPYSGTTSACLPTDPSHLHVRHCALFASKILTANEPMHHGRPNLSSHYPVLCAEPGRRPDGQR